MRITLKYQSENSKLCPSILQASNKYRNCSQSINSNFSVVFLLNNNYIFNKVKNSMLPNYYSLSYGYFPFPPNNFQYIQSQPYTYYQNPFLCSNFGISNSPQNALQNEQNQILEGAPSSTSRMQSGKIGLKAQQNLSQEKNGIELYNQSRKNSRKKRNQLQKILQVNWDRNAASNLLKIYLKQTKQDLKKPDGYHFQLFQLNKLNISLENFLSRLEFHVSPSLNYIRPDTFRKICLNQGHKYDSAFSEALRVSLTYFLTARIFRINELNKKQRRIIKSDHLNIREKMIKYLLGEEKQLGNILGS